MAKKQKKDQRIENNALFTERPDIAAEIKAVARRLQDGGHSLLRTRAHNDDTGSALWLEAVKNPLTLRWALIRQRQLPDGTRYQEPARAGSMCFFDALYFCAGFELQYDLGAAPLPAGGNAAHYSIVANAADIPLDDDGLPHPAVNGAALTTAVFSPTADAVLARTVNKDLPPELEVTGPVNTTALIVPESKNAVAPTASDNFIAASIAQNQIALTEQKRQAIIQKQKDDLEKQKRKASKNFSRSTELAKTAHEYALKGHQTSSDAVLSSFALCPPAALASIGTLFALQQLGLIESIIAISTALSIPSQVPFLTIIVIPALAVLAVPFFVEHKVQKSSAKKLFKAANKLPEGDEKNLIIAFTKATQSLKTFKDVSKLQKKIAAGKGSHKKLEKLQAKGLKLIDRAADEINMPEEARQNLKNRFCAGTYPKAEEFDAKLTELHTRLQEKLQARIDQIHKDVEQEYTTAQLPPPASAAPKALPAPSI